ncbi:MAG: hypothetical protein ACYS8Z_18025 [Planctomycetota bacterium]|jgi:hypothetical protein
MASEEKELSDQEKHEAALKLLKKLKDRLVTGDISDARLAGHKLAWMQEDGLTILREVLFGKYERNAKKAAAYGLRSMNGRMKKLGRAVLEEGLKHRNRTTKAACVKAIFLMDGGVPEKSGSEKKRGPRRNRGNRGSDERNRIREFRRKRRSSGERNKTPQN